jgi:hypothetical protein
MALLFCPVTDPAPLHRTLYIRKRRILHGTGTRNPPALAPHESGIEITGIEYPFPFHLIFHHTKVC